MTGPIFIALCLGLTAALWIAAAGGETWKRFGRAISIAALAAGPALIAACLLLASLQARFGEIRLALVSVAAEIGARPLSVGGDAGNDDIVVDGASPGVAALTTGATADGGRPTLRLILGPEASGGGSLISIGKGGDPRFPTAIPFREGEAVCVESPCNREGASWAILKGTRLLPARLSAGEVVAGDERPAGLPMPHRKAVSLIAGLVFWSPGQAIHPLRDHFPHPATQAAGVLGDCDVWLCAGAGENRRPAASYLFQEGGFLGHDWRLVLADPGARKAARDADGRLRPVEIPETRYLDLGAAQTFALWEPRYREVDRDDRSTPRGWLQERRSLTAELLPDGRAQVTFRTRSVQVVGKCSGPTLVSPLARVTGASGGDKSAAAFTSLGGLLGAATSSALPHPPDDRCNSFLRDQFEIGPSERQASYVLERFGLPWPMIWISLAWLLATVVCAPRASGEARTGWAILTVLQFLLALRWLIALSGTALDPALDWRGGLSDGAIAYVVAPAILVAWMRARTPLDLRDAILVGLVAATVAATWLWSGRPSGVSALFVALFGVAMSLRLLAAEPSKRRARSRRALKIPQPVQDSIARVRKGYADLQASLTERSVFADSARIWPWLLVSTIAVRFFLGCLGVKERFGFGGILLAVSVIYTPLLVFGFASLMKTALEAPVEKRAGLGFWFATLLIAGTIVMPLLVRDVGYAITLAPIAGIAAWGALSRGKPAGPLFRVRLLWALPVIAAAIVLLSLPFAGPVATRLLWPEASGGAALSEVVEKRAADRNTDPEEEALALLASRAKSNQNWLRLFLVGAPDWLASAGTSQAETLRVWSSHLSAFTASTWGRGYLIKADIGELRPVQMTDNLPAVHLMSPFGRAGAAAFLLLLASLPLACARYSGDPANRTRLEIVGYMSLWIVAAAAIYMTLANLQLLPFTGRNIYLLSALSGSDQLEGVMLLFLAYWALSQKRVQHGA